MRAVVNDDLVVFGIHRLFQEGLIQSAAIQDQIVLIFLDTNFLIFIQQFILLMVLKAQVLLFRCSMFIVPNTKVI